MPPRITVPVPERCQRWRTPLGIHGHAPEQTPNAVGQWFEQYLLPLFGDRILPVTQSIGDRWGVLGGECQLKGTPLNTADGLIAATALEHGLIVVTRNVKDFARMGVALLDPWIDVP